MLRHVNVMLKRVNVVMLVMRNASQALNMEAMNCCLALLYTWLVERPGVRHGQGPAPFLCHCGLWSVMLGHGVCIRGCHLSSITSAELNTELQLKQVLVLVLICPRQD